MSIYLDHNASTPLHPQVRQVFYDALNDYGNASSTHAQGRRARMHLDDARRSVAHRFGIRSEQVVFTSGGTEANNLALKGVMAGAGAGRILLSPTEHASVIVTARAMAETKGVVPQFLVLDSLGLVDLHHLEKDLASGQVKLVSVMLANNETGVIQPIAGIAEICKAHQVLLHVDAVQGVGKIDFTLPDLGADFVTVSFHKSNGPKGVGALLINSRTEMAALLHGGGQERNSRAGSENIPAIAAAGRACELLDESLERQTTLALCRDAMEKRLLQAVPTARIVGQNAPRLANTSLIVTPGFQGQMAVMGLDLAGVSVSSGSACASGRTVPSHVLLAYGYSAEDASCGLRVSSGLGTTEEDIDAFINAYTHLCQRTGVNGQKVAS